MINKTLLLALCLLPVALFSQIYGFNRQSILTFTTEKDYTKDIWLTTIEVEIQNKYIILRRPPNGIGEKKLIDTLIITGRSREKDVSKFTMKDGRLVCVYHDTLITMVTKENRKGARVEYCFYNQ
jgi:hypothetical protein